MYVKKVFFDAQLSAFTLKSFPSPGVNTLYYTTFLQEKSSTIYKTGEKYYEQIHFQK